ncbi:hypothetical protein L7F22_052788 [Adiantum nelumboides]|nr:hypothetical protein [Adiantum nelumboides]
MSFNQSQGESSRNARENGQESEQISWSIHAAPESSQEDEGSSSSGSSEDGPSNSRRNAQRLEQDHAIRLAHAMTHNPADALLPSPPRSPPRAIPNPYAGFSQTSQNTNISSESNIKIITVNDVKNRNCWICSDGDADEAELGGPPRKWIHPCKCSLMAHEECLLTWIRTRRTRDPKKPIQCPQCSHIYGILEQKPGLLRLFESGNKLLRDALPIATAGVVGGSVLVAATAYGCAAIRLWVGKDAAGRVLGGKWPWHYYLDIPIIPFALVFSRFRVLDYSLTYIPTMVLWPIMMFHMPYLTDYTGYYTSLRRGMTRRRWDDASYRSNSQYLVSPGRTYPPSPGLTILLVPWVRAAYIMLKYRITRKVLAPFSRRVTTNGNGRNETGRRQTRLIVIGEDAPVEGLDQDGTVNVDENGNPRELPPGAEAIENDRTVYVSAQSLARLIIGALSGPLIANLMGKLLAKAASYSNFLRRFLGMDSFLPPRYGSRNPTRSATPSATQSTPLGRLFSTGSIFPKPSDEDFSTQSTASVVHEVSDGMTWFRTTGTFDDLDPVWFRNAIGAGIFIVIKDIVQLRYRYLRLEHAREGAKRTKIVDRPFVGGIVGELELRDEGEKKSI